MLLKTVRRNPVIRVVMRATTVENVQRVETFVTIVVRMGISPGTVLPRGFQGVKGKLTEVAQVLAEVEEGKEVKQLGMRVTVTHCVQPTVIDVRIPLRKVIHVLDVQSQEML